MQPPEHIIDEDLMIAMNRINKNKEILQNNQEKEEKEEEKEIELEEPHIKYISSVGLLLKLLKGSRRLWKRGKITSFQDEGVQVLYDLWKYYAEPTYDINYWTPLKLHTTAVNVNKICREISPGILRDLDTHLLRPSEHEDQLIYFERDFLLKVLEYHRSLERPDTTFSSDKILIEDSKNTLKYLNLIQSLAQLPREICPNCKGKRHIYCGDCQGLRMIQAEEYLPNRIVLPVNIALLLHWRESLHKCTGIHAAVLSISNTVECIPWLKENHDDNHPGWDDIVRQFDSNRDVLLYPYEDSISAELFPWWENLNPTTYSSFNNSSSLNSFNNFLQTGRRLIVLEGSWEGAKTMANRIVTIRERLGLDRIPSITLPQGITSHYWRLQHMGSSAVSTIEAIAHTISIIEKLRPIEINEDEKNDDNLPEKKKCRYNENDELLNDSFGTSADILLLLFNLQRHRMLTNVKDGARVPIAIAASNNQGYTTSWSSIIEKQMNN